MPEVEVSSDASHRYRSACDDTARKCRACQRCGIKGGALGRVFEKVDHLPEPWAKVVVNRPTASPHAAPRAAKSIWSALGLATPGSTSVAKICGLPADDVVYRRRNPAGALLMLAS
jgi:hypothetical protein